MLEYCCDIEHGTLVGPSFRMASKEDDMSYQKLMKQIGTAFCVASFFLKFTYYHLL